MSRVVLLGGLAEVSRGGLAEVSRGLAEGSC